MTMLGLHHSEETKRKLALLNIGKTMSPESRLKMSESGKKKIFIEQHLEHLREARRSRVGDRAPCWKGGVTVDRKGYLLAYVPDHPYARTNGYYPEHRLIIEKALGRFLKPSEVGHHADGIKDNNRNDNLVARQDESYHQLLHRRARALGGV